MKQHIKHHLQIDKLEYVRMGRQIKDSHKQTLYYPVLFNTNISNLLTNIHSEIESKLLSTIIFNENIEQIISFFIFTISTNTVYNVAYQLSYIRPSMIPIKNAAISVIQKLYYKQLNKNTIQWQKENNKIIPNYAKYVLENKYKNCKVQSKLAVCTLSYSSS